MMIIIIITLIPLATILRQTQLEYQISKNTAKIRHFLYMDDPKLYGKSTAELELLMNTVRIFITDIPMEFGIGKCATFAITKDKVTETEGMNLPNNNIKELNLHEIY